MHMSGIDTGRLEFVIANAAAYIAITRMQVLSCAVISDVGKKKVTECLVGDSSGTILFKARGKEAEEMTSGRSLRIKGCKVDMMRGSMRLVGQPDVEFEEIPDVTAKVMLLSVSVLKDTKTFQI
jgi:hypothetical protein